MNILAHVRKYRSMILASIFFFYLGCGIALSFSRIECVETASSLLKTNNLNKLQPLLNIEYAVIILTSPDNEEKRDAIRATWANFVHNIFVENGEKIYRWNHTWTGKKEEREFVKIYFAISSKGLDGMKLLKIYNENNRSNDLLILDSFEDSYENLATKVLHSIRWLSENLPNLKYVVKCDDDSFVRIDLIIRDLEAFAPKMSAPEIAGYVSQKGSESIYKGLYWGYFDGRAQAYLTGKWQEKDWFLCDKYLPYALGGGYVISKHIVNYVGGNYDILAPYNSEDVSMGVWTAALRGINRVHDTRFDTEWKSRGCHKSMLVRHKQTPKDMFNMYSTLVHSRGENLCQSETMTRKSYMYKWNVLPSMCCR